MTWFVAVRRATHASGRWLLPGPASLPCVKKIPDDSPHARVYTPKTETRMPLARSMTAMWIWSIATSTSGSGPTPLAEDLTSETFLRALRRIADFTWQGRDFGAWLVTIARNLVADHFKSGRYRLEVTTGEVIDVPLDGPHPGERGRRRPSSTTGAARRPGSRPEQQECVVLRFLHGLSLAETALIMGKKRERSKRCSSVRSARWPGHSNTTSV